MAHLTNQHDTSPINEDGQTTHVATTVVNATDIDIRKMNFATRQLLLGGPLILINIAGREIAWLPRGLLEATSTSFSTLLHQGIISLPSDTNPNGATILLQHMLDVSQTTSMPVRLSTDHTMYIALAICQAASRLGMEKYTSHLVFNTNEYLCNFQPHEGEMDAVVHFSSSLPAMYQTMVTKVASMIADHTLSDERKLEKYFDRRPAFEADVVQLVEQILEQRRSAEQKHQVHRAAVEFSDLQTKLEQKAKLKQNAKLTKKEKLKQKHELKQERENQQELHLQQQQLQQQMVNFAMTLLNEQTNEPMLLDEQSNVLWDDDLMIQLDCVTKQLLHLAPKQQWDAERQLELNRVMNLLVDICRKQNKKKNQKKQQQQKRVCVPLEEHLAPSRADQAPNRTEDEAIMEENLALFKATLELNVKCKELEARNRQLRQKHAQNPNDPPNATKFALIFAEEKSLEHDTAAAIQTAKELAAKRDELDARRHQQQQRRAYALPKEQPTPIEVEQALTKEEEEAAEKQAAESRKQARELNAKHREDVIALRRRLEQKYADAPLTRVQESTLEALKASEELCAFVGEKLAKHDEEINAIADEKTA